MQSIRRAFREFLALPAALIAAFLILAVGSYALDHADIGWLNPLRAVLKSHVFADALATSSLLSTIATGLITVTSITISLLLLSVAQSAGSLTSEVVDQFLRRKYNQVYFGFFIGLSLYALLTLATVSDLFNPVFGAALAFLLTVAALSLLLVLLYTSVNQMRPVEIIETIHDHLIRARLSQLDLVARTRRSSSFSGSVTAPVRSETRGFVTRVDLDLLAADPCVHARTCEVRLAVSIGTYVAFQDTFATVHANNAADAERVGSVVGRAVHLERQRDVATDPTHGLSQLEAIAWTSISSSKSNPAPGLLIIHTLRDALARWSVEVVDLPRGAAMPVVYYDNTFEQLLNTFESLAVVSSESMQHQNYTEVVRTFALMFNRIPREHQPRAEDVILRILSGLADHVLTAPLNTALTDLASTLRDARRADTMRAVVQAHERMKQTIGVLHSRSTRTGHE